MSSYVAPTDVTTGELATASVHNTQVLGNIRYFQNRIATEGLGLRQTFRSLHLRTHPDADKSVSQVMLVHADEIVMHDGTRTEDWNTVVADLAASGAGGLDTGSEVSSAWYEVHAIRKSSDGARALLLHRAKEYQLNQDNYTALAGVNLRDTSATTALAQGFQTSLGPLPCPFVDVDVKKTGSLTGRVWITLEANSGGAPSGTALATSDRIDANTIPAIYTRVRFPFRMPVTLSSSTQYWLVVRGDFAINASNYLTWSTYNSNVYPNGVPSAYGGSTWTNATNDFNFKVYLTRYDTAVTMPNGYDQRALIGWVYNDASGNAREFIAYDRVVRFKAYHFVVYSGTDTVPTLVDMSPGIPPIACYGSQWQLAVNGTNGVMRLQATPSSGLAFDIYWNPPSYYWSDVSSDLPVEYQHCYYWVTNGIGFAYLRGFRW